MKAVITAVVSAIEALAVALLVFTLIAIPSVLIWWLSLDMAAELSDLFSTISQLWQLVHLVPMQIVVSAKTAVSLGLAAETLTFTLSVAPLGLTLVTIVLGFRSGWRFASRGSEGAWALLGAFIGYLTVATLIASTVVSESPWPFAVQALVPALMYGVSGAKAFIVRAATSDHEWWLNTVRWVQQHMKRLVPVSAASLPARMAEVMRVTFATLVTIVGLAAFTTSVNIILHYVDIVTLGQSLNLNALSLTGVFLIQLVLLPIAWIWAIAWLSGAGFSIGIATSVTPFETLLGPLPALPLFGAVPTAWGWAGALAPVLIIAAAAVLGAFTATRPLFRASSATVAATIMLSSALVTGAVVAGMSAIVHGSIGPGRLAEVGPDPWSVAGFIAVETAFGLLLGVFARRVDLDRLRDTTIMGGLMPKRLLTRTGQPADQFEEMRTVDLQGTQPLDDLNVTQPLDDVNLTQPQDDVPTEHTKPSTTKRTPSQRTASLDDDHVGSESERILHDVQQDPLLEAYSWDSKEIDPLEPSGASETAQSATEHSAQKFSNSQLGKTFSRIGSQITSGIQSAQHTVRRIVNSFLGRDDHK